MRWVSYRSELDGADHAALADQDTLYAAPGSMLDLLREHGSDLTRAAEHAKAQPFQTLPLHGTPLLAPVPVPPSIRDFMAFEQHVATAMGALGKQVHPVWYEQPVFYFSNTAGVLGPDDPVPVPPGCTMLDYELEVAAVIGRGGSDLDPNTAEQHIAGYTILCDWSARDLQAAEMAVGLGPVKGKDTANSLGPYLVTPDELAPSRSENGYALRMSAQVNGRDYSEGSWHTLHWSFGQMLAYASRGTTLRPGDVIGSGTVGTGCILELSATHGAREYPWLAPGDQVRLAIEKLGEINATIVAGAEPVPLR